MAELLSLVINAGGESRRMGRSKALLPLPPYGEPLIRHVLRRLAPLVTGNTIIVTGDPQLVAVLNPVDGVRCIPDHYPDAGPLGGMATGLRNVSGWALMIACDLPLVDLAVCQYLVELAHEAESDATWPWLAVVPVVDTIRQPLHAVYHRQALPALEKQLAAGERRAASFLVDIPVRWVTEAELQPFDPYLRSFVNVNTPEEWAAVRPLV
jgi:molybdopterin-guanine dinucleotide biosynthesis protein A